MLVPVGIFPEMEIVVKGDAFYMKKQVVTKEDETDWYVSQNPIDRYLKVVKIDNKPVSKFVRINSERHSHRQKTK